MTDLAIIDSRHLFRLCYLQFLRDNLRKCFQQEYLSKLIHSLEACSRRGRIVPGYKLLLPTMQKVSTGHLDVLLSYFHLTITLAGLTNYRLQMGTLLSVLYCGSNLLN